MDVCYHIDVLKRLLPFAALVLAHLPLPAADMFVTNAVMTCRTYEPGSEIPLECWAPEGLKDGEGAVYFFMEHRAKDCLDTMKPMMADGRIPPGIGVFIISGWQTAQAKSSKRQLRAEEFDQAGCEFPNAIVEEIIPEAERRLGVKASRSPDLHFIAGNSSGGHAAWNACWYRNDYFRRCYLSSPTFCNMRLGNLAMPLVRKCEPRPIRVWMSGGTVEPDYYFGDSYHVAADAAGALRSSGYEIRFERFPHEGHGTHWGDMTYVAKTLEWLFADWRTKPVAVPAGPRRFRDTVAKGSVWERCGFTMPPPVREVISTDRCRAYSVSPTNRFVMSERIAADGSRDGRIRLAPLELAWNVSEVGGRAIALTEDDRTFVATELGVQCVVSFGLMDLILPLPGDLPCDNVAIVGKTLYASSGDRVFRRPLGKSAADPSKCVPPSTPAYGDSGGYMREHRPDAALVEPK